MARAGDELEPLDQPRTRYAVEILEPEAQDNFFRLGVNSVLEKKQAFSEAHSAGN